VIVLPLIRPPDDHDDELGVGKHDLVPNRGFEKLSMLVNPFFEIERSQLSHTIASRDRWKNLNAKALRHRGAKKRRNPLRLGAFALRFSLFAAYSSIRSF
jgi:hypothetical protein